MKKIVIFLCLLSPFVNSYGQEAKVLDSLLVVLSKSKQDTSTITLLQKIGLEYKKTDMQKAVEYTLKSKDLSVKTKNVEGLGKSYLNLGEIYRLNDKFEEAKKNLEAAANIFKKINKQLNLAYAYNNLGMVHEDMSDNNTAINYYLQSLKIKEELKDTATIGTSLSNIGVFYARQSNTKKAEEYFTKALSFYHLVNDSIGLSKGYNNLGILNKNKGNYQKAIECYLRSLKIKELTGNKAAIPISYENIGGIYAEMKNYQKALFYLNKSLALNQQLNSKNNTASVYNRIGLIHYELQRYDSANVCFNKALDIFLEINSKRGLTNVYNNLGLVAKDQEQYNKALDYFNKSLQIDYELNNRSGMFSALTNMGVAYGELRKFDLAEESLLKAIEICKTDNYKFGLKEANKYLSDVYLLQNKFDKALKHHKIYTDYKDSLMNEENLKGLNELEAKYESERKEREIMELNHEKELSGIEMKRQKEISEKRTVYFVGGLTFIVIIAIVLFIAFIQKKKSNIILTKQKELIQAQKHLVEEKNKEILDSITYAKRLQEAILPPQKLVKQYLNNSFILYKPKDIVAGDFYWMAHINDMILFAAADCTGHGVPGAMVSVVCSNALNRTVKEFGISEPGKVLDKVRELVIETFEKSESEVKDGMDISLCALDLSNKKLLWSGANNPLWIVRKGKETIEDVKADKQPIGRYADVKPFNTHTIDLNDGDSLYIFTDGYADQFGGALGKKYKSTRMKELILSIQKDTMDVQREKINVEFEEWKGDLEQVDDVCVIGVRV